MNTKTNTTTSGNSKTTTEQLMEESGMLSLVRVVSYQVKVALTIEHLNSLLHVVITPLHRHVNLLKALLLVRRANEARVRLEHVKLFTIDNVIAAAEITVDEQQSARIEQALHIIDAL